MKDNRMSLVKPNKIFLFFFLIFSINIQSYSGSVDSLKSLLTGANELKQTEIYLQISSLYLKNNPVSALEFANIAYMLAKRVNDESLVIKAMKSLISAHYEMKDIENTKIYFDSLLKKLQKRDDKKLLIEYYKDVGSFYKNIGNYEVALNYYYNGMELVDKKEEKIYYVELLNYIGAIHLLKGSYTEAIDNFDKSIYFSRTNNLTKYIMQSYSGLANVYFEWKKYLLSIEYYEKVLQYGLESKDQYAIAKSSQSISRAYINLGNYTESMIYANQSLELFKKLNMETEVATSLIQLAEIYYSLEKFQDAVNLLSIAEKKLSTENLPHELAKNYTILGSTYIKLKKTELGLSYLLKSLDIFNKYPSRPQLKDLYYEMSGAYESRKDFGNAYLYLKKFSKLRDSLFTTESERKLNLLLAGYTSEKQERENEILRQRNSIQSLENSRLLFILIFSVIIIGLVTILAIILQRRNASRQKMNNILVEKNTQIEKQNIELNELNVTKDKFFSIIAHDLMNPISSFKNLTEVLYTDFQNFNDEEKQDFITVLKNSSVKLFELLGNLLTWSRSQRGIIAYRPENFDLKMLTDIEISTLKLTAENKKITLTVSIPENILVIVDNNMVRTVIRNLITNAIKFTPEGGRVEIRSETLIYNGRDQKFAELSVKDTGIGLSGDDIQKLFRIDIPNTKIGSGENKGTGLGLIICKEFVEKHGGKIYAESRAGSGCTFKFTIPLA